MRALNKTLAITALAAAIPMAHAAEISGNVTLTSDYKFRGISQTDEEAAIQGGFDVAFDNGFYIGTWGSNVDFANSLELDYYFGFSGDVSEGVSYDIGYLYYDYPGTESTVRTFSSSAKDDYQEIYGSLSFGDLTVGFAYSDDYYLETGEFEYYYADYSFSLPEDFSLDVHYGYNSFEFASDDSDPKDAERAFLTMGADDYADYSVTVGKSVAGLDLAVSWVDTDLDKDECFGTDWCDSSVVFSVSKSM